MVYGLRRAPRAAFSQTYWDFERVLGYACWMLVDVEWILGYVYWMLVAFSWF